MVKEGRVCRTYREEQRSVRIEDSSCRVEKYVPELCGERETDAALILNKSLEMMQN